MKTFFIKHPIIFTVFVLVASRIIGFIFIQCIMLIDSNLSIKNDLGWLLQILYMSVAIILIRLWGNPRETGLRLPKKKEWLPWIPTLLFPIYILIQFGIQIPPTPWKLIMLLLAALGVASNEEIIFRGLFMNAFIKKGVYQAIFIPAIIFGLLHLPNLFLGTDKTFAIFQVSWAVLGGVALGAMRIRSNSLLPFILFHFLVDGTEYLATGEIGIHPSQIQTPVLIGFMTLSVLFGLYALLLLKKDHPNFRIKEGHHLG